MGTHPIFESDFDCLTEMKIGLKSIAFCFAFANGYGLLKSCPDVRDAKWEALVIRQLKNLMKTRKTNPNMVVEAVGYTCPSMSNLKCKPSSNGRNKRKRVCTVLLHGTYPNGKQGVTYLPRNYDESGLYCFAQFDTISTMTQSRKRQNKIVRTSWETKCEKVYQTRTSDWSGWSDCDITCNQNNEFVTGKRERTRYCIKGTSNIDGFKPLPCPTSSTFEYDYTCSGVCRNATEKLEITGDNGDVFYLSQSDPNQPT